MNDPSRDHPYGPPKEYYLAKLQARDRAKMKSGEIKRLLFVDCETTGLDPKKDEIIEIAAALVDLETRKVVESFDYLIEFTKPIGFDPGRWAGVDWSTAVPLDWAMAKLELFMCGETLAGQNPSFDLGFIRAGLAACGIPYPDCDYHVIDVSSLVMPLVLAKRVEGISLRHTRLWAGAVGEQSHRAGQDVADTIEVFFKACDVFNIGLATQHELDLALSGLQPMTCAECSGAGVFENVKCETCKGSGCVIRPRL